MPERRQLARESRAERVESNPSRASLIGDFHAGAGLRADLFEAPDGITRELEKGGTGTIAQHRGLAGVPAQAYVRIQRNFAEEVFLHLLRSAPAAPLTKYVDTLVAV